VWHTDGRTDKQTELPWHIRAIALVGASARAQLSAGYRSSRTLRTLRVRTSAWRRSYYSADTQTDTTRQPVILPVPSYKSTPFRDQKSKILEVMGTAPPHSGSRRVPSRRHSARASVRSLSALDPLAVFEQFEHWLTCDTEAYGQTVDLHLNTGRVENAWMHASGFEPRSLQTFTW